MILTQPLGTATSRPASCQPRCAAWWSCCALLAAAPSKVDPVCANRPRLSWPSPASEMSGSQWFTGGPTAWIPFLLASVGLRSGRTLNSRVSRGRRRPQRSHTETCLLWLSRWGRLSAPSVQVQPDLLHQTRCLSVQGQRRLCRYDFLDLGEVEENVRRAQACKKIRHFIVDPDLAKKISQHLQPDNDRTIIFECNPGVRSGGGSSRVCLFVF